MKKFIMLVAIILVFTISVVLILGCGEKKVEDKAEEVVEEVVEEAAVDTTAVDSTATPPDTE